MMKKLLFTIGASALLLSSGCNSCSEEEPEYEVMTRYGGWKAREDETADKVRSIENRLHRFTRYEFDSIDHDMLNSPYPYWENIHIYLSDEGLQTAKLYSDPRKGHLSEHFYYENGKLILARVEDLRTAAGAPDSLFKGEEYFFLEETLVLALDTRGDRKDLSSDTVKLKGIDLLNESRQIARIIATKEIDL